MIRYGDGKALVSRIFRRPFRHCPGLKYAPDLEPQIEVEVRRMMFVNDKTPAHSSIMRGRSSNVKLYSLGVLSHHWLPNTSWNPEARPYPRSPGSCIETAPFASARSWISSTLSVTTKTP